MGSEFLGGIKMTWILLVGVAISVSIFILALNGIDIRITKTIIHVKEEKEEKDKTPVYNKSVGVEEFKNYYERTDGQNKF